MSLQTIPRRTEEIVLHAVTLQNAGVGVQQSKAATLSRENAALGCVSSVETLTNGEGWVTEDSYASN